MLARRQTVIRAVWPRARSVASPSRPCAICSAASAWSAKSCYQKVGELSGGERSRAALARLVVTGVNVLVLDEPTNHLDLWACDALEQALLEFEGTVIVVSHDRYFLNRVVDVLIVFEGDRPQVIYGNYDTYERLRAEQLAADRGEEVGSLPTKAGGNFDETGETQTDDFRIASWTTSKPTSPPPRP